MPNASQYDCSRAGRPKETYQHLHNKLRTVALRCAAGHQDAQCLSGVQSRWEYLKAPQVSQKLTQTPNLPVSHVVLNPTNTSRSESSKRMEPTSKRALNLFSAHFRITPSSSEESRSHAQNILKSYRNEMSRAKKY